MEPEYFKFASKIREDLYRKLKVLSALEGKSIQELLEQAVSDYLTVRRFSQEDLSEGEGETRLQVSFVSEPSGEYTSTKRPKKKSKG